MANIIQQFKNANGDNIFPLAYAQGGCKMDLLWTNPSPTSDFTAQTISLDLSDYELFLVFSDRHKGDGTLLSTFAVKNKEIIIYGHVIPQNGQRDFTITDSGISFNDAIFYNSYSSGTASTGNGYMIPCYIYGIKMSYIVPTSVHGLQYVEV